MNIKRYYIDSAAQLAMTTIQLCNEGAIIYYQTSAADAANIVLTLKPWNCFTSTLHVTQNIYYLNLASAIDTQFVDLNDLNIIRNYYFISTTDTVVLYHFADYQPDFASVMFEPNNTYPITIYPQPIFGCTSHRQTTTLHKFIQQIGGIGKIRIIKSKTGEMSSLVADISRYTRLKLAYQIVLD